MRSRGVEVARYGLELVQECAELGGVQVGAAGGGRDMALDAAVLGASLIVASRPDHDAEAVLEVESAVHQIRGEVVDVVHRDAAIAARIAPCGVRIGEVAVLIETVQAVIDSPASAGRIPVHSVEVSALSMPGPYNTRYIGEILPYRWR